MPVTIRARLALCVATTVIVSCGTENERGAMTERTRGEEFAEQVERGIRARAVEGVSMGVSVSDARFVRVIGGLQGPESVKYDAEQDVYFITNMFGAGSTKDGNGYIVRVSAAHPESASVFVQRGLDAPKGTALHADTLWVADISVLRAFDKRTGAPLGVVDFAPLKAVQLNDVAVGPDGRIRVTDTGIMMSPKGVLHLGADRVFLLGPNRAISEMPTTPAIGFPNGITWDSAGKRWLVVTFDPFVGRVFSVPADGGAAQVLRQGSGRLDGVEVLRSGEVLFTSWADSSLHLLHNGADHVLIREIPEAADIGVDTRRNRVAIPLSTLGQVQLWSLGASRP